MVLKYLTVRILQYLTQTDYFSYISTVYYVFYPQLMEKDLKPSQMKNIPLEFETATQLLKGGGDVLGKHFCLE